MPIAKMKFTLRSVVPSLSLAALLLMVPSVAAPAGAAQASPAQAPLERALATIDPAHIKADLRFLADDAMRGRDTVSEEQRIAARFLRSRVERLGFTPGAGKGFLYQYPLVGKRLAAGSMKAALALGGKEQELQVGRDYVVAGNWAVADLTSEGGIVYCGKGGQGDFDAEAVRGNWALCTYSGQTLWRMMFPARQAGAIGILLISEEGADFGAVLPAFAASNDPYAQSVSWPSTGSGRRSRGPFPVLALSDTLSAKLMAAKVDLGTKLDGSLRETRAVQEEDIAAEDVVALWPGSDPALKKEVIIVSAHYDHVGARGDVIYNGADDNGSGTSGLLALAEALHEYGPMPRTVMLIWVSGEEKGLWGSKAWSQNPSLPEGMHAVADINIDMIGRNAPKVLYVTPSPKHKDYNGLTRLMESFGAEEGFGDFPEGHEQGFDGLGSADEYYQRSDHAEFAKLGIPVCFLFAGVHEDYHQPSDTVDKIDFDKIHRVVRMVLKGLDALQAPELKL